MKIRWDYETSKQLLKWPNVIDIHSAGIYMLLPWMYRSTMLYIFCGESEQWEQKLRRFQDDCTPQCALYTFGNVHGYEDAHGNTIPPIGMSFFLSRWDLRNFRSSSFIRSRISFPTMISSGAINRGSCCRFALGKMQDDMEARKRKSSPTSVWTGGSGWNNDHVWTVCQRRHRRTENRPQATNNAVCFHDCLNTDSIFCGDHSEATAARNVSSTIASTRPMTYISWIHKRFRNDHIFSG